MIKTMLAAGSLTVLGVLPVFLLSAQSVLVRDDLGFSEVSLGVAVSSFFAAAAVTAFVIGRVVDSLGRRRSTMLAGALATGTCVGIAAGASSYPSLVALLVLAGVTNAALQITANLSMARAIPTESRGLGFGIKQSAVPVGILIGGLAVPVLGVALGWRAPYWLAGIAGLVVVVAGLRIRQAPGGPPPPHATRDSPPRGALAVSTLAMVVASASVNSLATFLPAWAFDVGMSPSEAGVLIAVASALSVLARVWFGAAADRRRGRNLPVVAAQLVAGAVGCAVIAVGTVPTVVGGTLVAFAIGWSWPGLLLFAVVRVGREDPVGASSAVQGGAFLGGAAGPALFGLLLTATSYQVSWLVAAGMLTLAAGLMILARTMFVSDLTRRPPRDALDAPRDAPG